MRKTDPLKNNKSALRWCKRRCATISFASYMKMVPNIRIAPETDINDTVCGIEIGSEVKIAKTFLQAVNFWIDETNKEIDKIKNH